MTKSFVQFEEVNDWEGETWTFWLQVEGNEKQLWKLLGLLSDAEASLEDPEDFPYALYLDEPALAEWVVDNFVANADEGYMDSDHKVTGVMTIPEGFQVDDLYKGGIKDLFHG